MPGALHTSQSPSSSPFYRWGNQDSERLSQLPKATQLNVAEPRFKPRLTSSYSLWVLPRQIDVDQGLSFSASLSVPAVFLRMAQKPTCFSIPGGMCLLTCRFQGPTQTHSTIISEEGPWNLLPRLG